MPVLAELALAARGVARWRVAGLAALWVLAGCSMSDDSKLAGEAVPEFHRMLDASQFDAIYDASGEDLRQAANRKDFVALLEAVHRKLGSLKSTEQRTWNVNYNLSGAYVTLTYSTVYSEGDATEQFVYRMQGGKALLAGYHINSNALVLK